MNSGIPEDAVCERCGLRGSREAWPMEKSRVEGRFRHHSPQGCVMAVCMVMRAERGDDAYIQELERELLHVYDALQFYSFSSSYQFYWKDGRGGYVPECGPNPPVYSRQKYGNRMLEDRGETARKAENLIGKKDYYKAGGVAFEMWRMYRRDWFEEPDDAEDGE